MVTSNWDPSQLLIVGIGLGSVGIGAVGILLYMLTQRGQMRGRSNGRGKRGAESSLDELSSKIALLEHKQRVLSVYTAEYFSTLHEAGWEELHGLIDNARTIETSLRVMFAQRQYDKVIDVCDFMLGLCSEGTAREIAHSYEGLSSLANWQEQARVVVLRLIQSTTNSAEQTAELGITRKRANRKPTLLSLSELKESLGDL